MRGVSAFFLLRRKVAQVWHLAKQASQAIDGTNAVANSALSQKSLMYVICYHLPKYPQNKQPSELGKLRRKFDSYLRARI